MGALKKTIKYVGRSFGQFDGDKLSYPGNWEEDFLQELRLGPLKDRINFAKDMSRAISKWENEKNRSLPKKSR